MQVFTLALAAYAAVLATIAVGLAFGAHRRISTWAGRARARVALEGR